MKKYISLLIYFIFIVPFLGLPMAKATMNPQAKSLTGLKGFEIVVEYLDKESKEAGLSEEYLRTYIEQRLRTAGIHIYTT